MEIINYETGYHIQYLLDYFTHDYTTNTTDWDYQNIFTELEPNNDQQKNAWDKKRKEVYQVSITRFIKSLYNNTLLSDGFVLTSGMIPGNASRVPGWANPFRSSAPLINPDNILTIHSSGNSKILNLPDNPMMLISYGRPVNDEDMASLPRALNAGGNRESVRWEQANRGVFRSLLRGGMIRIFPDGTYLNRLYLSPVDVYNPLLNGLSMKLPVDYLPVTSILSTTVNAHFPVYGFDNINESFEMQLNEYPQEKIHLHTDRDFYAPGEKIWFKAYVTDAPSGIYNNRFTKKQ
jgi:hypothetical protein